MSIAADLIAMGVDVMAQDGEIPRGFPSLRDLIVECAGANEEQAGLREVVRMLRDAADSAVDAYDGAPDVDSVTMCRMRRFSTAMGAALKEIT